MKALSVRQPWAWCIIRPDVRNPVHRKALARFEDIKPVENRTWPTKHRGPLLIHAGQKVDLEAYAWIREHFPRVYAKLPPPDQLQKGGIIGRVMLTDCAWSHLSRWKMDDQYALVLDCAEPLPFVEMRGQLSLFEVPGFAVPEGVPLPPTAYTNPERRR